MTHFIFIIITIFLTFYILYLVYINKKQIFQFSNFENEASYISC